MECNNGNGETGRLPTFVILHCFTPAIGAAYVSRSKVESHFVIFATPPSSRNFVSISFHSYWKHKSRGNLLHFQNLGNYIKPESSYPVMSVSSAFSSPRHVNASIWKSFGHLDHTCLFDGVPPIRFDSSKG